MKTIKTLAVALLISSVSFATYATCITCSNAANNGKCYDGGCSNKNESGSACCGTYVEQTS